MIYEIGLEFSIDRTIPPPNAVIHDALESVRGLMIEAPTLEAAEHYADRIRLALIEAGN